MNDYPIESFKGNIHVIDNMEDANIVSNELLKYEWLGFDTETRPSFTKGKQNELALLQLSNETDAFLFRVQKTGIPNNLYKVLNSKKILKIGAAIHDDIKDLTKIRKFNSSAFVDIQKVAKKLEIEHFGLKKLCPLVLGYRISKRQQLSNWEAPQLGEGQQKYAATDAWVCLELYKILKPYLNDTDNS